MQAPLYLVSDGEPIQTLVISRQRDFDRLFDGFTEMRAVSYVTSAELLLEFLESGRFERIELLVGDNMDSKLLKDDLKQKSPAVTERLALEVEAGKLRILTTRRTVHTKLYILKGRGDTRVIVTSANLTQTARRASAQTNYAWYLDAAQGHPMLQRVERDYETHCKDSALFMGDLIDLFRKRQDLPREEIVTVWLGSEESDGARQSEIKAVLQTLGSGALAHPQEVEAPVIHLSLPTSPAGRREAQKLLAPLGIDRRSTEASVSPAQAVRYVEEHHRVPLMRVYRSEKELRLGFRGKIDRLDTALGSPEDVDEALEDMETYVNTIKLGQCPDPAYAAASMYEAILYVMASPFANEEMREKRRQYGIVNRRGPLFLYIYGPAQNGKTTFLRYCSKLITGSIIEPPSGDWLTKRRGWIPNVQAIGTCFPLMFDDMTSTTSKTFENVAKSYWETTWTEGDVFPQLIFTSNSLNLKDWAKSRIKRVDFDVHFVSATETQHRLARILEKPNPLFGWFARRYLERLAEPDWLRDDELATAREVMIALYWHAGRKLPEHLPTQPLEQLYDPDLRIWKDLSRYKKVAIRKQGDRTIVVFSEDLDPEEIRDYRMALPQTVKYRPRGRTLIVENPGDFHAWLRGSDARSGGWLRRLLRRG